MIKCKNNEIMLGLEKGIKFLKKIKNELKSVFLGFESRIWNLDKEGVSFWKN